MQRGVGADDGNADIGEQAVHRGHAVGVADVDVGVVAEHVAADRVRLCSSGRVIGWRSGWGSGVWSFVLAVDGDGQVGAVGAAVVVGIGVAEHVGDAGV